MLVVCILQTAPALLFAVHAVRCTGVPSESFFDAPDFLLSSFSMIGVTVMQARIAWRYDVSATAIVMAGVDIGIGICICICICTRISIMLMPMIVTGTGISTGINIHVTI